MIINRTPHEIVIGGGRTRVVLPAEPHAVARVLVPGDQVRDSSGKIIGCRSLAWADTSLPGLSDG